MNKKIILLLIVSFSVELVSSARSYDDPDYINLREIIDSDTFLDISSCSGAQLNSFLKDISLPFTLESNTWKNSTLGDFLMAYCFDSYGSANYPNLASTFSVNYGSTQCLYRCPCVNSYSPKVIYRGLDSSKDGSSIQCSSTQNFQDVLGGSIGAGVGLAGLAGLIIALKKKFDDRNKNLQADDDASPATGTTATTQQPATTIQQAQPQGAQTQQPGATTAQSTSAVVVGGQGVLARVGDIVTAAVDTFKGKEQKPILDGAQQTALEELKESANIEAYKALVDFLNNNRSEFNLDNYKTNPQYQNLDALVKAVNDDNAILKKGVEGFITNEMGIKSYRLGFLTQSKYFYDNAVIKGLFEKRTEDLSDEDDLQLPPPQKLNEASFKTLLDMALPDQKEQLFSELGQNRIFTESEIANYEPLIKSNNISVYRALLDYYNGTNLNPTLQDPVLNNNLQELLKILQDPLKKEFFKQVVLKMTKDGKYSLSTGVDLLLNINELSTDVIDKNYNEIKDLLDLNVQREFQKNSNDVKAQLSQIEPLYKAFVDSINSQINSFVRSNLQTAKEIQDSLQKGEFPLEKYQSLIKEFIDKNSNLGSSYRDLIEFMKAKGLVSSDLLVSELDSADIAGQAALKLQSIYQTILSNSNVMQEDGSSVADNVKAAESFLKITDIIFKYSQLSDAEAKFKYVLSLQSSDISLLKNLKFLSVDDFSSLTSKEKVAILNQIQNPDIDLKALKNLGVLNDIDIKEIETDFINRLVLDKEKAVQSKLETLKRYFDLNSIDKDFYDSKVADVLLSVDNKGTLEGYLKLKIINQEQYAKAVKAIEARPGVIGETNKPFDFRALALEQMRQEAQNEERQIEAKLEAQRRAARIRAMEAENARSNLVRARESVPPLSLGDVADHSIGEVDL